MNCFSAQQSDKTLAHNWFAHAPFLSQACSPQRRHILSPISPAHAATPSSAAGPGALEAAAAGPGALDEAEGPEAVASAEAAAAADVCGGAGPAAGALAHEAAAPAEPLGMCVVGLLKGSALNGTGGPLPAWPGTNGPPLLFAAWPGTTFGSGPGTGCST